MNLDDPKLTAFALEELDEPQRSTIARAVAESPEAQRFVDETCKVARALKNEYAAELEKETPVCANLINIRDDPWFWSIARPLAIAAMIAVCALVASLAVVSLKRPHFQSEQRINIPAAEEVGPNPQANEVEGQMELAAETPAAPTANAHLAGGFVLEKRALKSAAKVASYDSSAARALIDRADRYGEFNTAAYDHIVENPFLDAKSNPLSTFSIDVDTASYSNIRRFINEGSLPPKDAVRVEEMINYFAYDYREPEGDKPFSIDLDATACPWDASHRLLRIGLKGREVEMENRPASNLVFLLDVSGSMMPAERLPLVKQAMRLLVDKLTEKDRVAIVLYAGGSGLVLNSTSGKEKEKILRALEEL